MMNLSIVIVNYNAGDHLLKCLQSIEDVKDEAKITIWLVDNASHDDSIAKAQKKFPKINYILSPKNVGFGAGNNLAFKKIDAGYVLLLNPDTVLQKGVLSRLLDYYETHQDIGAITCKIVFDNGKTDLTAHRGFPTPWASLLYLFGDDSLYHLTNQDLTKVHEIDALAGAFMLTKKSILKDVDYFDEDYFMYAEDIDLCYKIKQKGLKIIYIPDVSVIHYKGVSTGLKKHSQEITTATKETRIRSMNAFYETMIIFYNKHYKTRYPFFINWLVYSGIYFRWWLAKRKLTV